MIEVIEEIEERRREDRRGEERTYLVLDAGVAVGGDECRTQARTDSSREQEAGHNCHED